MNIMQFNGGQTPQRTIPRASTDKGHVLWSLIRQGAQTGEELRANTNILEFLTLSNLSAATKVATIVLPNAVGATIIVFPFFNTSAAKTC